MIKLKNVSKYYYSKGIVASGLSNINLELNFGEFVVITGESGSGKSTLLNVISGLDTYEEGELYINDVETSHFTSSNFEMYRKKYIGNIFQDFNLVNSYTVYQNIELALFIKGKKKKEIKNEVYSIIEKVGLSKYAKTKCSRLSGGQKQRVAIARALAKNTPIIVADEPTGNLDSESAHGIISLLKDISKDKLVIVVTHNYDQFEHQATRVIKMNDGKIGEDKKMKDYVSKSFSPQKGSNIITGSNQLRLGVRNTFNVFPKFLLLLIVFMFVTVSVTGAYTSFRSQNEERDKYGYNEFFPNYKEDRIVVKKSNNSAFKEEDYEKLENHTNIKSLEKNDMVVDTILYTESDDMYFDGYPIDANSFNGKVDVGRAPEGKGEALIACDKEYTFMSGDVESNIDKNYSIYLGDEGDTKIKAKIVGIKYVDIAETNFYGQIYLTSDLMKKVKEVTYKKYSQTSVWINGKTYSSLEGMYTAVPNSKVPRGEAYVPRDVNSLYRSEKAIGKQIAIDVKNVYFSERFIPKITKVYSKKSFESLTGYKDFDLHEGEIYINNKDYNNLYKRGYYQSSVYVKNVNDIDQTLAELQSMGFKTIALKDHLIDYGDSEILSIIQIPFLVVFIIAIFFIAYFVTRLILKSRGVYFATLRMLGLAKKNIKRILDIELCIVVTVAYGITLGVIAVLKNGIINIEYLQTMIDFFKPTDYIILYVILLFMAFLISRRFAKNIFKKSAMVTFREEA